MKDLETRLSERKDRLLGTIDEDDSNENPDVAAKESKAAVLDAQKKTAAAQPAAVKKTADAAQWTPNQNPVGAGSTVADQNKKS